jgi:hypothetical protein
MFKALENINTHPKPFEFYTAGDLWTDEHTSQQMLAFHGEVNRKLMQADVEKDLGASTVYRPGSHP